MHYSRAVGTQKLLPFLFPSLDNEPSIKEADAVLAGDILCNYVGEQQRQREQKMVEARKSKTSTIPRALSTAASPLPFPFIAPLLLEPTRKGLLPPAPKQLFSMTPVYQIHFK